MTAITGILVQMITGRVENAGTDGRVYLGIGGREFRLDSADDDYERGSLREYVLGHGPVEPNLPSPQVRVSWPEYNDPRKGSQIDSVNLAKSPTYIRFEPEGDSPNWNLASVFALLYTGTGSFLAYFTTPGGFDNLWLGDPMGKIVYLTDSYWQPKPQRVLGVGLEQYITLAR